MQIKAAERTYGIKEGNKENNQQNKYSIKPTYFMIPNCHDLK